MPTGVKLVSQRQEPLHPPKKVNEYGKVPFDVTAEKKMLSPTNVYFCREERLHEPISSLGMAGVRAKWLS